MRIAWGLLIGLVAAAWLGLADTNAASVAAVTTLPAACDIRAWNVYEMPDGKTYAIVLRSQSGSTSGVRLHLYSDLNDYEVVLPGVKFDIAPIDPDPNAPPVPAGAAQYESPPLFFTLPKADPLLLVDARESGLGSDSACRIRHYHTDAWGKMFAPPVHGERYIAQNAQLTQTFKDGIAQAAAASLTSTATTTCSLRYERSRGSDVNLDSAPALVPKHSKEVAKVLVDLGADGTILGETLLQSTGNPALDDATLDAVSKRTYQPEIFRCEGLDGSSVFQMTFR